MRTLEADKFAFLDMKIPTLLIIQKGEDAANILEECNRELWEAPGGALRNDACLVIDMKCSLKLQEIQMLNGAGEFSTKGFSVFGSNNSTGPWSRLYTGELERVEAVWSLYETGSLYYFVFRMDVAQTNKQTLGEQSFTITNKVLEKMIFYKLDSYYKKGGGLLFLKLLGTRQGY